jgi:hypothetical protein
LAVTPIASSLYKHKYADEEAEDSTVMSKKRWAFGDDDGDDDRLPMSPL